MKVYVAKSGEALHLWRECLPMRSHHSIRENNVDQVPLALLMSTLCKRCRFRLG